MKHESILLVEDDDNDDYFLELAFAAAQIDSPLKLAQDGAVTINYLAGRNEFADRERFPLPSLVLMDLKLPRLSGFEVLAWLRSDPVCRKMIVIILSASALSADVDRAYELGANSYLVKPSDLHKREQQI